MASSRRLAANVVAGIVSNVSRIVIQIIMLPLMARLLGPAELGLYALAIPMISFVLMLSDGGLGDSLAREKADNSLVWSSAFWGLLLSGSVLAVIVCIASVFIAMASGQPRLPLVVLPLSLTLIMVAATVIPYARMLREGKLTTASAGDLAANIAGAVISIFLAYKGFGVWAMVTLYVSTYFIRMVIFNVAFPFWPKFEFSWKALVSHSGVGGAILGGRLIDVAGKMVENTCLSRTRGVKDLGVFGYANQISRFLTDAVGNPLWANLYYAAIHHKNDEVVALYLRSHRFLIVLLSPVVALTAVMLPDIVPKLLGSKWDGLTMPMSWLLLSSPFLAMGGLQGAIMYARGRSFVVLAGIFATSLARVLIVWIGYAWGLTAIAIGISIVNILFYVGNLVLVSPLIGNRRRDMIKALPGPVLSAAAAAMALFYFIWGKGLPLVSLAALGLAALAIYVAILFVIDHRQFKADLAALTGLIDKRQTSPQGTT